MAMDLSFGLFELAVEEARRLLAGGEWPNRA